MVGCRVSDIMLQCFSKILLLRILTFYTTGPAGVRPPYVTSISPTSVQVEWEMPVQANGVLEEYILRFPDPQIEIRNTSQYQIVINDLTAYTQYSVTLTACTSKYKGECSESEVYFELYEKYEMRLNVKGKSVD